MKIILQNQHGWRSLIRPYFYSTLAIGASVTIGDGICQYLERKYDEKMMSMSWLNKERSFIMCTTAAFVTTPWSFTLSRTVERLFPGKASIQIVKKMFANCVAAPIGISLVFTSITLLKGQSLHQAKHKVKTDMPRTFLAGMCYWPFVSFINFRFIPLDYRPFLGSIAGCIWNIYISSVANKSNETSNQSQQLLGETVTILIAESSGTPVPALEQTWRILEQTK